MRLIRRIIPEKWRQELSTRILVAQEYLSPKQSWDHSYAEMVYLRVYYQTEGHRILFSRGFPSHQSACADLLRKSDLLLVYIPCFAGRRRLMLEAVRSKQMGLSLNQVVLLTNTSEDRDQARSLGFRAEFVNHNCWIDESTFRPLAMEKIYDAVLISSPLAVKRWQLAAQVPNLALLSHTPFPEDKSPLAPILYQERISPEEVARVINQSRVCLCLSANEGACLAASESILCGTPVVSTPSDGGRDVWFTPNNHVLCEDNGPAVGRAVKEAIDANFDPSVMREEHIRRAQDFRDDFIELTERLGAERGMAADWTSVLRDQYVPNMVTARPIGEVRRELER